MKILYTLNSGSPGGMERHVQDLVFGLVSRGHEVHVWCRSGVVSEWYRAAGAVVTESSIRLDIDPIYIYRLATYIRKHKINLVHAHELKASVNAILAGKLFAKVEVVTHIHTPISQWKVSSIKKIPTQLFYALVHMMFSVKEIALTNVGRTIKLQEGIPESDLVVIPNAIDFERFHIDENSKQDLRKQFRDKFNIPQDALLFGVVSRLTEEKGVSVALHAFHSYLQTKSGYLVLAGGGHLQQQLQSLCRDLGIEDKVKFTGVFKDEDLVKIYAGLDIFLFPTYAEGFGLALLEAMTMALPVICSRIPVLTEVSEGRVESFKTGDAQDLRKAMLNVSSNFGEYRAKALSAVPWVQERYSMSKFINSYESLYNNIVEKRI